MFNLCAYNHAIDVSICMYSLLVYIARGVRGRVKAALSGSDHVYYPAHFSMTFMQTLETTYMCG